MAKKETVRSAMQWKTVTGLTVQNIAFECEKWSVKGWEVFTILGPFSDGMAIVLKRMLTL